MGGVGDLGGGAASAAAGGGGAVTGDNNAWAVGVGEGGGIGSLGGFGTIGGASGGDVSAGETRSVFFRTELVTCFLRKSPTRCSLFIFWCCA